MLANIADLLRMGETIAYVDGGTGSLIFQVAIGGALSGVYFMTTQWRRLKGWMTRSQRKDTANLDS